MSWRNRIYTVEHFDALTGKVEERQVTADELPIVTEEVKCSGRENPDRDQKGHRTVPVALWAVDGLDQWAPTNLDVPQLRHGRVTVHRRGGNERALLHLPDGTEIREGDETITVECLVPGCGRNPSHRASTWSAWLNSCRERGVSPNISDGTI